LLKEKSFQERLEEISVASTSKSEIKVASAAEHINDDVAMSKLPISLSEIYDISNRNRWKNKDKKRNRDNNGDESNGNNNDKADKLGDNALKVDKSVEGSVSLQ
jgi:hypothetical protein